MKYMNNFFIKKYKKLNENNTWIEGKIKKSNALTKKLEKHLQNSQFCELNVNIPFEVIFLDISFPLSFIKKGKDEYSDNYTWIHSKELKKNLQFVSN
jgi:hypothetical protein